VTSTGKLQVLDSGGGQIILTTNSLNLNAFSRIEYHITHSLTVGQVEIKIFNSPDSAVATETIQTTANKNLLASANQIRYGATGGDSDGSFWLDNIVANALSYPGPVAPAFAAGYAQVSVRDSVLGDVATIDRVLGDVLVNDLPGF
jgi:hypothetical protein